MRSAGTGSEDRNDKCPKCTRFIQDAEFVAFRVDSIQLKLKSIEKFLADNEWVFIENAELMRHVRDLNDVDMESFNLTRAQIIKFSRYIDKVTRIVKEIEHHGDNFCREQEIEHETVQENEGDE